MILTVIFLLLTLLLAIVFVGFLAILISFIITAARKKPYSKKLRKLKKLSLLFVAVSVLNVGLVFISQLTAYTPDVCDDEGNTPENSISELIQVELNGRKQSISIRGTDKSKPVLLFLAGGPGGTQLAAVRYELGELEKHFVMVGWDQPGAGKSYNALDIKDITVETYVQDGYKLTEYLLERFGKEKIYLVGESWGSALGIFMIERHPELYYAFIGTGQMVDFAETERIDYEKAIKIAKEKKDNNILKKLEANGVPPYYGKDVTWKSAVYLNYLNKFMSANPEIHNPGFNTLRDIFSSEYGIFDKINYVRGIINTFNHVYQQLYDIDLRKDYTKLSVPVYFFIGRHDVNAPPSLVEDYFTVLEAPEKEIVWFEYSGHNPWINENKRFVEELLMRFR